MTTFFTISILILVVLGVWRKFHQSKANLKFKYDLYTLRDELRMMAYEEKIDNNSQIFDYFDYSLSKAISESHYITLFRVIALMFKHVHDEEFHKSFKQLERETNKYPELVSIKKRYNCAIQDYILDQHFVSGYCFMLPLAKLIKGTSWVARQVNKLVAGVLVYPETSASGNFGGAFAKSNKGNLVHY